MLCVRGVRWAKNCFHLIVNNSRRACSFTQDVEKKDCSDYIVWLDMEMTGLNINTSHILEVACVITDNNLSIVSEELDLVIHQPDEILENMEKWSMQNHKRTGLTDASRQSIFTIQDAEQILLKYLQNYVKEGTCPLAGSSVYVDRMFLQKYMQTVDNYLHYRIIDTSTIQELVKWKLDIPKISKCHDHRALSDIKESIRQLEHYRVHLFNL
ncbi:oligoribonuclease isoform X2 [Calliopsis andreniformis]|uniref:oligoribonuclease isoform X2 n=1 Tax=Calliopsis andreniformis TaxID=337506 RepID=UPI003FCCEC48